jgi:hypothetical protein
LTQYFCCWQMLLPYVIHYQLWFTAETLDGEANQHGHTLRVGSNRDQRYRGASRADKRRILDKLALVTGLTVSMAYGYCQYWKPRA